MVVKGATSGHGWKRETDRLSIYQVTILSHMETIRSSDNDSIGFWPPGSLHTLMGTFNKEIGFYVD